ncbi:MAG: hypothetical protein KO318_10295 [Methanobacterium sp.]|jgi:membrane protease subunit (stomatin/prohibitin family)|uniref:hypothetical protein n=1 Tax=Methanobacterium sp. TaxID=2164 RepID=UPI002590F040|nr:hypothetical protein [Methanobacterium sp.]MCC7560796.1 hypothetical protein [Methanobacterium sp.]
METKYLVGVLVLIVAISGATACSFLLPSSNPVQNNAATSVSSPVAGNDSGTQEQTQKPANNQKTVQAQKVTCTKCGGSGVLKCTSCGGSGKLKGSCVTCGGDGKVYIDGKGVSNPNVIHVVAVLACHEETCSACGGTGGIKTTCTKCGGDGKISCPACGGDGYT